MMKIDLDCTKNGIKKVLLDYPWNKYFQHANIVRVKNWEEAMKEIEKMTKQWYNSQ